MKEVAVTLQALPGYQLKLVFPNGSVALIDMKRRIRAMRFRAISQPERFAEARLEGDEVVWGDGANCVRASINELLDSMQMD